MSKISRTRWLDVVGTCLAEVVETMGLSASVEAAASALPIGKYAAETGPSQTRSSLEPRALQSSTISSTASRRTPRSV
jgi:hypothetical protein